MVKRSEVLDEVFSALSDPTRRGIVERLTAGPASVSELARPLPMSLPAVTQHLQILESCGLIHSEKVGRVRTCRLEVKTLQTAQGWIEQRRRAWEAKLDRLGDYLDQLPPESAPTPSRKAKK